MHHVTLGLSRDVGDGVGSAATPRAFNGLRCIALALTLVLASVSKSKFLVPLHAVAHSVPSSRECAPWCARFHCHNIHTYPVWDIHRQLDWCAISLQPPTASFSQVFSLVGGQPPFVLELLPVSVVLLYLSSSPCVYACFQVLGTQQVFNIPSSAFSNGVGSYYTSLQFPQGHQFLATMSDASGFATGGISPLLTVQAPTSQSSDCNTVDPGPQFVYGWDSALQQCQ